MKSNVMAKDLYISLENIMHLHRNLNEEVDSLNEKPYHNSQESTYLRKLKQQRLYLKDQIVQLHLQLQIKE